MSRGRVYVWTPDRGHLLGGRIRASIVPLERLEDGTRLCGRHVEVRNGGAVNQLDPSTNQASAVPIGDAIPNADGDFLFEPGRGGGRLDKVLIADADFRWRYEQASHFGEVNSYFHLDAIASYVHELLAELGAPPLPRVVAVVNAHHAVTEADGKRDGLRRGDRWVPFQGGHYRLPSRRFDVAEHCPISPTGEIHLGPGRQLLDHGALVEAAGGRDRANASHNAGILYHEYGHHLARHTADFRANCLRRPERQNNRKTAMEEGTCDYWTATMLDTPHIWAWHRRHDEQEIHPRSLASAKTMSDFASGLGADPHANGTIWATSLWTLRSRLGARATDLLVLKAMLLIGQLNPDGHATVSSVRRMRKCFATGLAALMRSDELLNAGRNRNEIAAVFLSRGIQPDDNGQNARVSSAVREDTELGTARRALSKHMPHEEIPLSEDLLSASSLQEKLDTLWPTPFTLLVVGDIMLGDRARNAIAANGPAYPFATVLPLLRKSSLILGNLEGPFASKAKKVPRTHSYRVDPRLAFSLAQAGFGVLNLANNHLLDCGREGVVETLDVLKGAGIAPLGAGIDGPAAHAPVVRQIGPLRIGLLGYYWNRRCAATGSLPGSAMDEADRLAADIHALRKSVDRIVVTHHWGVPYVREPSPEDRAKARFAVDCGADVVIGHHPHIVQPFEIYRGRPIFYSVGNFVLGSGNSRAEGIAVGLRFEQKHTEVGIFPLYVKNRDPRVAYQPKVMAGNSADRVFHRLAKISGSSGTELKKHSDWRVVVLPHQDQSDR